MKWIGKLTRRRVVVHTVDQRSLRGVLVAAYRDCLVLDHAEHLGGQAVTPIDGQAVVPRENVAWLQDLPGGDV